ncbi:hypothetical protein KKF86_07235 [bacterium]|nr:hypothetical protein [bacterium]
MIDPASLAASIADFSSLFIVRNVTINLVIGRIVIGELISDRIISDENKNSAFIYHCTIPF